MKAKQPPAEPRMWAVMKACSWGSIQAMGFPLSAPKEGPHRFIPVFNTKKQAVAFAGSAKHVFQLAPAE